MVQLRPVDPRFLHCYLIKHDLKLEDLDLGNRSVIRNRHVVARIKESYSVYQTSNLSLDDFFDCQIVDFVSARMGQDYWTRSEEISRKPLLLCSIHHTPPRYSFGIKLENMQLKKPIRISLQNLFSIYDIDEIFQSFDFDEKFQ